MSIDQLQALIAGVVSLTNATAKSTGKDVAPEEISRTARSFVEVMHCATRTESEPIRPPGKHILWVDDRPNNNIEERRVFESIGFRFTLALSTQEALEILARQRFAAIISDMGRKEGPQEGYMLLEAIRARGDQTPLFFYAGSKKPEHRLETQRHGGQGCTNNPQELFHMIVKAFMSTS